MLHVTHRALGVLLLVLNTLLPGAAEARQLSAVLVQAEDRPIIHRPIPKEARAALPFARTELYFGTARSDGVVTEEEFQDFIDDQVTPRFPDGLTVLKGNGQFRGEDDNIVKEQSFVLILLYPRETFEQSTQGIEQIRTLYKELFDQESVLRVDDPFIVWVSF